MGLKVALWVGFHLVVVTVLVIDLGLSQRRGRALKTREAAAWTLGWCLLSLAIGGVISVLLSPERGAEFFTGYVVEYALSVDNLFVFLLLFAYFKVAPEFQHRLLSWGILAQLAMRAPLLILGTQAIRRFHWVEYVFGAFLVYSAVRTAISGDDEARDPEKGWILRVSRRLLRVSRETHGVRFVVREEGRLAFTPMFLVLVVINVTDLMFAFDSIPAVLGVTQDPFVAYTSNVCAIFGLRSLFSVVSSLMGKFRFLKVAVSVILAFVGLKMIASRWIELPTYVSLGFIGACLAVAIAASAVWPARPASS